MKPLSPKQVAEMNALLEPLGYQVKKQSKPRSPMSAIRNWKPETPAGRACKSSMLYWARMPKPYRSALPEVLAMFGVTMKQVNPWPEVRPGNYGPALANAMNNLKLLTYGGTNA